MICYVSVYFIVSRTEYFYILSVSRVEGEGKLDEEDNSAFVMPEVVYLAVFNMIYRLKISMHTLNIFV